MEVKVGHGPKIFIATKLRPLVGTIVVAVTSHLCFLLLMQFVEQWWGRMESLLRVPSFSVPNYNLFRGISFPGPTLSALRTRRSYFVNSKLCKSLKLAILLISRDKFCSWTMHIDAVVPLSCPLWMRYAVCGMRSSAETTAWPPLQYLLINVIDGHRILSHISFPACGWEWSYLTSSIALRCPSSRRDDTSVLLW